MLKEEQKRAALPPRRERFEGESALFQALQPVLNRRQQAQVMAVIREWLMNERARV